MGIRAGLSITLALLLGLSLGSSLARAGNGDGELVKVSLPELHPTQMNVGMAEVELRKSKLRPLLEDRKALKEALKAKPGTAVRGPGNQLYLVDGHHFARAASDVGADRFYVKVIKDWSRLGEKEFWERMQRWKLVYLGDGKGGAILPEQLPKTLSALGDDPYRSLAWMVRKAEGYEKSEIPFQEFRWADFYRTRIKLDPKDPHALKSALKPALALADSPEARTLRLPGRITDHAQGGLCDIVPFVGDLLGR